ncbi:MAG: hypothetical protein HYZ93_06810 [Candidatus Omnitrophica bacterium]|nr:hypothetical protein [Candidatus Omnitrophota bacterium]
MAEELTVTHRNKRLGNGFTKIPHVVILGAGASKAAFPNGTPGGLNFPLMEDLVEVVGLAELLESSGTNYQGENFEVVFSRVAGDPQKVRLKRKLEEQIFEYFSRMQLPPELTIYDKLILSLRDKDVIATFNWDPLLLYAYRRCGNYFQSKHFGISMPQILFLHGNVALGVCVDDSTLGPMDSTCSKCQRRFKRVPLLYPILKKDYILDPVIKEQWDRLRYHMANAYFATIFGYGAPVADIEAVRLMKEVWDRNPRRELAEIEIIDIASHDTLKTRWERFIVREHYRTCVSIERSYSFQHPRRSVESFFDCFLQNSPWPENPMPDCRSFEEMANWLAPLLVEENRCLAASS